jgi:hypothetical protein
VLKTDMQRLAQILRTVPVDFYSHFLQIFGKHERKPENMGNHQHSEPVKEHRKWSVLRAVHDLRQAEMTQSRN